MQNVNKVESTVPVLGMNLTDDPMNMEQGEVSFALNAVLGKSFYQNIRGTKRNTQLPAGFHYLGKASIDSDSNVVFITNPVTKDCEIGIFRDGSYERKVSDSGLGFDINKPIQAKVKIDFNGHLIVYYTDNAQPMRRINLTVPPILNGRLDIDAINVYPKYTIPNTVISEVLSNGALLSGSYFITGQYADANGNGLTQWFTPVGPVPIIRDSYSDNFDYVEGVESNQPTDKAIKVQYNNLDSSFQYFNVGFVRVIDGVKRAFKVATIPVAQTEYIFNGAGNTPIELDLNEILKPTIVYDRAKTVEVANDILIWGGLTAKKPFNLQQHFNNLQVQWQVDRQLASDNKTNYVNPVSTVYRKTFRYNEVYAIGIRLRFTNGSKSQVFHVPGRPKNYTSSGRAIANQVDQYGIQIPFGEWDTYSGYQGNDIIEQKPRWKTFNTAFIVGNNLQGTTGPAEFGEMGYYESIDRYPLDTRVWGDLAGQPIRFHKMPDQSIIHLHDGLDGNRQDQEDVYINYLGIRFRNIEEVMAGIPEHIRKDIQGWEVVIGDRTYNKSVICSGLLYNTYYTNWRTTDLGQDDVRLYQGYPFNDLRQDYYHWRVSVPGDVVKKTTQGNNRYRKDVFTFLSPDTSFSKVPLANGEFHVHAELYGTASTYLQYLSPYPKFFDRENSDPDDAAFQSVAIGWYNNYKKPRYGQLIRKLKEAMYVPGNVQTSSGNIGMTFHNTWRESTVLLGFEKELQNTLVDDKSQVVLGDPDARCYGDLQPSVLYKRPVASYYGSIIRRLDNQYGSIYNIQYLNTNYTNYNVKNRTLILGGDTFICRFTSKRQHVFFNNLRSYENFTDGQKGMDFRYSSNIAHNRLFYYGSGNNARKIAFSTMLCKVDHYIGKLAAIYSGIPVFYAECDDNLCYRLNGPLPSDTYYRNLKNGGIQLSEWLGLKYIGTDNYFQVNKDFSVKNDLAFNDTGSPLFEPDSADQDFSGRTIYSLTSQAEDLFDNWRVYLPLNYYDFPKDAGAIWDIKYLGQYRTLFRLANGLYMDRLYDTLQSGNGDINLGNGRLFAKKPEKLQTSDNFYTGTRSQWAYNNTPFGAFLIDGDRGHVFHLTDGLKDISLTRAGSWFENNLPLNLPRFIKGLENVDNPCSVNGIGFHSEYDYKNDIWLLTKKDYRLAQPDKATMYEYKDGEFYFDRVKVSLTDAKYFENCSFTLGYSPLQNRWIAFYSFIPSFYLNLKRQLYSGNNGGAENWIHAHNVGRYCEFYGIRHPFIIEPVIKNEGFQDLHNLWYSFITKAFTQYADGRTAEARNITFNKAILYNSLQCSGLLKFLIKDENDLSSVFQGLQPGPDFRVVTLDRTLSRFAFSDVYDIVNSPENREGFFTRKWSLLQNQYFMDKVLDTTLLDYTRDYKEDAVLNEIYTKLRLIYDQEADVLLNVYLVDNSAKVALI